MDSANVRLWLLSLSTRLIAHRGRVNPLPAGPLPFVGPVKRLEALMLEIGVKLDPFVEKDRNCSLKCSLPSYRLPGRQSNSLSPEPSFEGSCLGMNSSSWELISSRGCWESGSRN